MNAYLFYGSCVGFLTGVTVATLAGFAWYFAGALLVIAFGVLVYRRTVVRAEGAAILVVAVLLVCVSIGVGRYTLMSVWSQESELDRWVGDEVVLSGVVDEEVVAGGNSSTLIVSIDQLHQEDGQIKKVPAGTRVRVSAQSHSTYSYGDRLKIIGELRAPEPFETDTGRVFKYDTFLAKDSIFHVMYFPRIERIGSDEKNVVVASLLFIKHTFMSGVTRVLPDPHASLANSMLVGARDTLNDEVEQLFRDTGLVHIVVLSGFHVTLIAVALISFLKHARVGLRWRSLAGVCGIILFAIMVGGGATVVRASIMAALVVVAHLSGHHSHALRALVLAAMVMVFINPMILLHDPSFQLSALATLGLVLLGSVVERWLWFVPQTLGLREIATATIATQFGVWPLLIYMTGSLSFVSIPVNLLALPAVAGAMLFSFLAGLAGMVSPVLALPVAGLAYVFLSYVLFVVETFNALPLSHVTVPPISIWIPIGVYLLFGVWCIYLYSRGQLKLGMSSLADRLS
ncbi:MAG: ComEC/Rec2 family competence protein [Candidatus Paceibacterota bacterium]